MWLDLVLMLIPGFEMRKFMHGSDQKSIRVEVVIDGDAVSLSPERMTVIPKPTAAALRYPKLAIGPHNPLRDKLCGLIR